MNTTKKPKTLPEILQKRWDFNFFYKKQTSGTLKGRNELNKNTRTFWMFKNLNSLKNL